MTNKKILDEIQENLKKEEASADHSQFANSEQQDNNEREYSDFEKKMMERGWNPNKDKTAEQWLDDGFHYRDTKVDGLHRTINELKALMTKQEKAAYERGLAELKLQKIHAIESGDVAGVEQTEKAIRQMEPVSPDAEIQMEVSKFKERNRSWLEGTSHIELKMAEVCAKKDIELMARNLPPAKHLEALEKYIHGEFPDYFGEKDAPVQSVEGGQSSVVKSGKKTTFTIDDLNEVQQSIARRFAKNGVMPVEQYIKELIKLGELK